VKLAELVLLGANVVYATSYVATRVTLGSIPPATLAFARLAIAWTALAPFARPRVAEPSGSPGDRRTIAWMGLLGFAAAYAFSHWASGARQLLRASPLLSVARPGDGIYSKTWPSHAGTSSRTSAQTA
jgi:drug/metabolite transporter (DMT)-like permease